METEVPSTANGTSSNSKNGINNVQIKKGFDHKDCIEIKKNESSEASNDIKITNNKSGASPKLFLDQNYTTNFSINSSPIRTVNSEPGDSQYFYEDEVFRIDKKGRVKFGIVLETPSLYSSDEYDEPDDLLENGQVRVVWYPECKEAVQTENSIALVDRTLMPGDIVRRLVPGKETQKGYCRDINMTADVKVLGTKYVIKNVNAERLRIISKWQCDNVVVLDSWVGSIQSVEEKAVLRTASGCLIEISSSDFYRFRDLISRTNSFDKKVFYIGNKIIGNLPPIGKIKILTPSISLHMNKKGKDLPRKFIIENIYTDWVKVNWQCKTCSHGINLENENQQPNSRVKGEDLKRMKRLNIFEPFMLQINDPNYLTYSTCDTIVEKSVWDEEQSKKYREIFVNQKEESEKVFVRTSLTGVTNTAGNHHHYEKLKKKLSLSIDDKSGNKCKRVKVAKPDKKESSQELVTHEKSSSKSNNDKDDEAEWLSTEDETETEGDNNFFENRKQHAEDCVSTTTTISTCSSPSPRMSPKHLTKRQQKKKVRKNFKTSFFDEPLVEFNPKEGDEFVTETLLVYSTVNVVWQDGTIEQNVPSTQLYPINHLDSHEYFPGDFVISGKEEPDFSRRDYGVIQTVDHEGRIAHVKWFTTYTSADEPIPTYKGESECSVYDLRDQMDFQYRPGIMVIRIANFVGEDANCTAGQVIQNCPDGRVKVWWVEGHISHSWPQDLFEVAQINQGNVSNASEDSWETESEISELGCSGESSAKLSSVSPAYLRYMEKSSLDLARLQNQFNTNPNLQSPAVIRKLLSIYKTCRYFDRFLNSNFFHEDNFMGLIERVKNADTQSMSECVPDEQISLCIDQANSSGLNQHHHSQNTATVSKDANIGDANINYASEIEPGKNESFESVLTQFSYISNESSPYKFPSGNNQSSSSTALAAATSVPKKRISALAVLTALRDSYIKSNVAAAESDSSPKLQAPSENVATNSSDNNLPNSSISLAPQKEISTSKNELSSTENNQLVNSGMANIVNISKTTARSQDDSGNCSRNENGDGSSTSCASSSDLTNVETNNVLTKVICNQNSIEQFSGSSTVESSSSACARLCFLLRNQIYQCSKELCKKIHNEHQQALVDKDNLNFVKNDDENNESLVAIEDNKLAEDSQENVKYDMKADEAATSLSSKLSADTSTEIVNTTEECDINIPNVNQECFQMLSNAPKNHKYHTILFYPNNSQQYYKAVQREHRLLKASLPPGVYVKVYEDRMDLISVMIEGPKYTPYEGGLFFFDIQLGRDYPNRPPQCHYISYCTDRLNPNLYEEGKVCISLLGTWMGKDTEVWGPDSTLLQVIVSIQGLILVAEPYFNEAGYEKQKGTQQGKENSRMYNEMAIIKLVQHTTKLIQNPPEQFRDEIKNFYKENGPKMCERIKKWMALSKQKSSDTEEELKHNNGTEYPDSLAPQHTLLEFPLIPASRGFYLTLAGLLENFIQKINSLSQTDTANTTKESETNPKTSCE